MAKQNLIKVAFIAAAHGVRGQVKIRCLIAAPEAIFSYKLTDESGKRPFKLTRFGAQKDLVIAAIDGVTDRNAAELLKGTGLFAPPTALPAKGENEWSYGELTGLEARLSNGQIYGRVKDIFNFGAGDILEIELPGDKSEMLPLKNAFVGDVRPEEGYLIVFPPDYVEAKENS